jgi:ribonuclease P protein component
MTRLTAKKDYESLRQSTRKVVGKYFLIVFEQDDSLAESMAGITVSRKVGIAVVRNKVKRRIRAFLREYTPPDNTAKYRCNIIALSQVVGIEWELFKADLEKCLRKICEYFE